MAECRTGREVEMNDTSVTLTQAQNNLAKLTARLESAQAHVPSSAYWQMFNQQLVMQLTSQIKFWQERMEREVQATVQTCADVLAKYGICYVEIYQCSSVIVQIEKYGTVDYILKQLRERGFEAQGEQDYMDDLPYSLIQITKLPEVQS